MLCLAAGGWLALLSDRTQAAELLSIKPAHPLPSYDQSPLAGGPGFGRGFYPSFAVGDFDEDGRLDVAVLEGRDSGAASLDLGVSVYLQFSDGDFVRAEDYLLYTTYTWDLITADFNGDGHLDLIASEVNKDLLILSGHGNGTFDSPRYLHLAAHLLPVAADLNGDGRQDLVAGALDGTVKVFTNDAAGAFHVSASLNTVINQSSPRRGQILIGDLNRDGRADVVVQSPRNLSTQTGNLDVFLGNGDGTFQKVISTPNVAVWRGALGDFNGDGFLDFAGDRDGPEQVEIWLGRGDGEFTRGAAYALTDYPQFIQTADLNADGILDLVVAAETTDYPAAPLSILLGKGDGTFRPRQSFSPLPGYLIFNLGPRLMDFNGDGLMDIVTVADHPTLDNLLVVDFNAGVKPDPRLGFLVKIQGATNAPLVLEHTADFVHWTGLATNSAPRGVWPCVDANTNSGYRFYRTRRP